MRELDSIDMQLIELLQADAKTPFARLGDAVGLSAPAVLERVRKLEAAGVIHSYRAMLDPSAVGLDVCAFIGVTLEGVGAVRNFCIVAASVPHILECHQVTGSFTLMLKVRAADNPELMRILDDLRELSGVTDTNTMVVLQSSTESGKLPICTADDERPRPRRR